MILRVFPIRHCEPLKEAWLIQVVLIHGLQQSLKAPHNDEEEPVKWSIIGIGLNFFNLIFKYC
jgi:hypothetical protein